MEALNAFCFALLFSFIGSIPPGTLNMTMIQLGQEHRMQTAWRFAIAAAIVEYPYAWLAIEFESVISSFPFITKHLQLITGVVMIVVGAFNLYSAQKPTRFSEKFNASGFRRGIVLSILNPMALPFWVGITAYLKSQGWITLSSNTAKHSYLLGVSMGALCLLVLFAYISRSLISHLRQYGIVKKIPGLLLIALGVFAIANILLQRFDLV